MNKQNAKLAHKMAYLDNPERNAIISPQEIFELISRLKNRRYWILEPEQDFSLFLRQKRLAAKWSL